MIIKTCIPAVLASVHPVSNLVIIIAGLRIYRLIVILLAENLRMKVGINEISNSAVIA